MLDIDMSKTNESHDLGVLARLDFQFDYAEDVGFVMPPFPFVPPKAKLYSVDNISFDIFRNSFSPLVGKAWGRVVSGLDHNKQGAYKVEGKFISSTCDIKVYKASGHNGISMPSRYQTPKDQMGSAQAFAFLAGLESTFDNVSETASMSSPVLLGGNWGTVRWAMVLMPKPLLASMERRNALALRDWFGSQWREQGEVNLGRVAIPFPFNMQGVQLSDVQVFNYPNVKCKFELNEDWTLVYFLLTDAFARTVVDCPQVNGVSPLMFDVGNEQTHVNLYSVAVRLLQAGQDNGLWDFMSPVVGGTVVEDARIQKNRQSLLTAFNGRNIEEDVVLDIRPMNMMAPPLGLRALPATPVGYFYVCDFNGVVYMTDSKLQSVFLPFQVFNLRDMYKKLSELQADLPSVYDEYDDSVSRKEFVFIKDQIELVEALFEHQEKVLKGALFNYEMGRMK